MSWTSLSGGVVDGNFTHWRPPVSNREGRLWIRLPGVAPGVSGSVYLGLGNGLTGVLDRVDSKILRLSNFAQIVVFDLPQLDRPVLGARFQVDSGSLPVLLPSFQFYGSESGPVDDMPWRFSQTEPATDKLWWETGADGLPIQSWPWLWIPSVSKWVSGQPYLVSGGGAGSNFKSGILTDDFPLITANIFIERIDYQFFLNTTTASVNWLLDVTEISGNLLESNWDSISMSGAPLNATRRIAKPLSQLRARPVNGWAWKVTRLSVGGSFDFKVQVIGRIVRP